MQPIKINRREFMGSSAGLTAGAMLIPPFNVVKSKPMIDSTLSPSELGKYDTPTICNVIELFNVRPRNMGYMDQRIKACFPEMPPMVGYALTATFRSAARQDTDSYSTLDQQILAFSENPIPPIVVFQDLDSPAAAATFGEIMCTAYQKFGATGIITSGAGRDLDQVQALGFPAFTDGTICAHGYTRIPSIQESVHVGGITIHPGDLLHGDRNGVTTIPLEIASEIPEACEVFVKAEGIIIEYLRGDRVTLEGFGESKSEAGKMIDELRQRVALKANKE